MFRKIITQDPKTYKEIDPTLLTEGDLLIRGNNKEYECVVTEVRSDGVAYRGIAPRSPIMFYFFKR